MVSCDLHVTTPPLCPVLPVKVIIRGERNTGKTALFHRLQGSKFTDAYQPTDEIQACVHVWGGVVHVGVGVTVETDVVHWWCEKHGAEWTE